MSNLFQSILNKNIFDVRSALNEKGYEQFIYEEIDQDLGKPLTPLDLAVKINDLSVI
jgi:hypothetical protein